MTSWKTFIVGRHPRKTLLRAVIIGLAAYVVFGHVIRPVVIRGVSMEPTLKDGGYGLLNLLAYSSNPPGRDDLVAVRTAGNRVFYLKRILGLPGETIAFNNGTRLINGKVMPEPYLDDPGQWSMQPETLGEEEYFIAGDNRTMAMQEHTLGVVDQERIIGKLIRRHE